MNVVEIQKVARVLFYDWSTSAHVANKIIWGTWNVETPPRSPSGAQIPLVDAEPLSLSNPRDRCFRRRLCRDPKILNVALRRPGIQSSENRLKLFFLYSAFVCR